MAHEELRQRYPGLLIEPHRNGNLRFRVRVEGAPGKRIALCIPPGHPDFDRHYQAAREGLEFNERHWRNSAMAQTGEVRAHVAKMLKGARSRAHEFGREFDLTEEFVFELLDRQRCACALSGIEFDLSTSPTRRRPYAPSLDRISTKGGYTKDNVRILTVVVNLALGDWGDEVLQAVARHIVLHGVPHTSKSVPPTLAAPAEALDLKRQLGPRK